MNLLQELNEQDEQDHSEELDRFVAHANDIGLKAKRGEGKWSSGMASAFAMRNPTAFDIMFHYNPTESRDASPLQDKVEIEYVLGPGKHYRLSVPIARFMSFEKDEVEVFHKIIQQNANEYAKAVKLVKEMPKAKWVGISWQALELSKAIKEIIKKRVQ